MVWQLFFCFCNIYIHTYIHFFPVIHFTDSYTCPCLWVGTSLGSVLVIVLNLPTEEQRLYQPVIVSPSGKWALLFFFFLLLSLYIISLCFIHVFHFRPDSLLFHCSCYFISSVSNIFAVFYQQMFWRLLYTHLVHLPTQLLASTKNSANLWWKFFLFFHSRLQISYFPHCI